MEKEELSIMVWDVIFYTEDEEGNQQHYRPKDKFDCSHIAESVDFEDLEAIDEEVEDIDKILY